MTHLRDVMDMDEFSRSIGEGWIRMQKHPQHPQHPLYIYNYTEKAVFAQEWNSATLACRGLITDHNDNVLARPFPKFFNHGESADPYVHSTRIDGIFDKLDGSLGIAYRDPNGEASIATRGSFSSDQAIMATAILLEKYGDWEWNETYTPLFEIIYPTNRIVLDYGDQEDLVMIGAVEIATGTIYCADEARMVLKWPGPVAEELSSIELDRANREGVVVLHISSNSLEKYKQEDYILLHRLVTNLNARTVYDVMTAKTKLEDFIAPFPDEVHDWIRDVYLELWWDAEDHEAVLHTLYEIIVAHLNDLKPDWTRGDFARYVQDTYPRVTGPLFFMLDERYDRVQQWAWDSVKPSADAFGRPHSGGIQR